MRGGEDGDILEAAPAHAGEPGDGKSTGNAPSCGQVRWFLYLSLYLYLARAMEMPPLWTGTLVFVFGTDVAMVSVCGYRR